MKKIWKKAIASVLAIALCVGTFMTTNWQTVSAEESTDGLKVIGASIRFINEDTAVDGIRFAVGIKADAYDAETQNYHLLVMPTALLTDGELTQGDTYEYTVGTETKYAYAQDITIDWANATDETIDGVAYKVVRIYLNQIDASYYTTGVTARAYYQDGTNAPVYSDAIERSYYSVANSALNDVKAEKVEGTYDNEVGSKFSPYDATQRDALLSVKYEKTGTWDYVDGNLVQTSATSGDSLTDRVVETGTGEYVISTSFKTRTVEELGEVGKSIFGGFQFAYDSTTGTFLELDYRSYTESDGSVTLIPSIRGYDGTAKTWPVYIGRSGTMSLAENTMYDFNIIVNESATDMYVRVMCRKSGTTDAFVEAIPWTKVTYGTTVYGDQVRMYTGRALSGHTYSPEIGYSEDYFVMQDLGRTITTTENGLTVSGTGASGRTQVVDLNNRVTNTGNNANFVMSVDMIWENKATSGWLDTGFQIGGYNMNATGSKAEMYFSPRGFRIYNSGWKTYTLESLAESINGLDAIISKIAEGTPVTWTIEAKTSDSTTTVKYYVDGILCVTESCANTLMYSNYIMYVANGNVTFSNLDLTGEIPEPEWTPIAQTTGAQSLKLDQTLNADGTGTIKGQFIHDYRTKGWNTRREGIKFSGTDGNGYCFWIGAQPEYTTPRFYVGLWKWTDGALGNDASCSPVPGADTIAYTEATTAGVTLQDNDEIVVDFEIVISINEGKKVFNITYALSHDTWKTEKTWTTTDQGSYHRGGSVYLWSEDVGDSTVADDIGDGKTIYNWVTVNGSEAKQGEPSSASDVTPMQTTGAQSLKLDQTLNADGTGTIKGQFVADYRTKGSNNRREGIKFSGANGNGYYFWIGAQPEFTTPRFYVGMWRNVGTDTVANWNNTDMSNGAQVAAYSLVTDAGVTLEDNDEIVVDFEITITITADNKKAFNITYTLSHGDWSYDGGWNLTDNRVGEFFTGGDVYLCSEDIGDPTVQDDVGDGKTVYNWITIDDSKAKLAE